MKYMIKVNFETKFMQKNKNPLATHLSGIANYQWQSSIEINKSRTISLYPL